MFLPPRESVYGVKFYRNHTLVGLLGYTNDSGNLECVFQSTKPKYTYQCLSLSLYTVTIPAENMTYDEQGLPWSCVHGVNSSYGSENVTLYIASKLNLIKTKNQN